MGTLSDRRVSAKLGSSAAPAAFPPSSLLVTHPSRPRLPDETKRRLIEVVDHADFVLARNVIREAAMDRATRQPHDNHLVRHLFCIAHILSDLADAS